MSVAQKLKERAEKQTHQEIEMSDVLLGEGNSSAIIAGKDALTKSINVPNKDLDLKLNPFKGFEVNNWIRRDIELSSVLAELDKIGAAIWMDHSGNFYFRRSVSDEIKKLEASKLKNILCNMTDRESMNIFKAPKDETVDIKPNDLRMSSDKFSPFVESEFYEEGALWYRTSFRPSHYILIDPKDSDKSIQPSRILWLILHLCNGNQEYFTWVINWLACFFQTLRKSQVSLVLKGDQGTGKGLFFEKIIAELFGRDFCVVVDDDRLGSNFKNWIGSKLFYNLNEISHDPKGRKATKNFIKVLVTDTTIQMEKKFESASETEIFANVLITSNENFPIEVEPSDRRFTVISTGASLKKEGVNTAELIRDIKRELEPFALFLKSYDCDEELYHQALDTPEKTALIEGTTDRFTLLSRAIVNKDLTYFEVIADENPHLFTVLKSDFEAGRIKQSSIQPLYEGIYDDDMSSKSLLKKLRNIYPLVFTVDRKKMQKSNGGWYYLFP